MSAPETIEHSMRTHATMTSEQNMDVKICHNGRLFYPCTLKYKPDGQYWLCKKTAQSYNDAIQWATRESKEDARMPWHGPSKVELVPAGTFSQWVRYLADVPSPKVWTD